MTEARESAGGHEIFASLFGDFLVESEERLDRLEELVLAAVEGTGEGDSDVEEIKLQLHTLKGNSGIVGARDLQALAHQLEDLAETLTTGAPEGEELLQGVGRFRELLRQAAARAGDGNAPRSAAAGSMRVAFAALDSLVDLLGEMVIYRNSMADALERHRRELGKVAVGRPSLEAVKRADERLASVLDRLREGVMGLRMVPLKAVFRSLARIVHDESARAGKRARFETRGGDTPLDKALLEVSSEALGHLVRNAVIHGLESDEARERAGKGEGLIRISAESDAREVRIDVLDDGGGIRRALVVAEAERRGTPRQAGDDPLSLIFRSGFSTRQSADLGSGRGVGLAAVREAVEQQGGEVEVFSEEGVGTLFRLHLPLSVSITRVLHLACDGEEYVLPLSTVVESRELSPQSVHEVNGALVLSWRGDLIPLLDLGYCFGTSLERRRSGLAVIFEEHGRRRAIGVERVHGIREVVVRGLDVLAGAPDGVAGTTILGDGRAVLILDPAGLAKLSPFAAGRPA